MVVPHCEDSAPAGTWEMVVHLIGWKPVLAYATVLAPSGSEGTCCAVKDADGKSEIQLSSEHASSIGPLMNCHVQIRVPVVTGVNRRQIGNAKKT